MKELINYFPTIRYVRTYPCCNDRTKLFVKFQELHTIRNYLVRGQVNTYPPWISAAKNPPFFVASNAS